VEKDAPHVLNTWALTFFGSEAACPVEVLKAAPTFPRMLSYEAVVSIPANNIGLPPCIIGESRSTKPSALMAAAYKVCVMLLEKQQKLPDGPEYMVICHARDQAQQQKVDAARTAIASATEVRVPARGGAAATDDSGEESNARATTPVVLDDAGSEVPSLSSTCSLTLVASPVSCAGGLGGFVGVAGVGDDGHSIASPSLVGRAELETPIKEINEYCQKKKLTTSYADDPPQGPSHDRVFSTICSISNQSGEILATSPGKGKKKKEAQQAAAQKSFRQLKDGGYA